ncbi:hypothetical protein B0H12DRAFT_1125908 [Mycena haematopus]|nr:hypothetical protein B0H12DRAFT_1125908 [Mycena haematopus]
MRSSFVALCYGDIHHLHPRTGAASFWDRWRMSVYYARVRRSSPTSVHGPQAFTSRSSPPPLVTVILVRPLILSLIESTGSRMRLGVGWVRRREDERVGWTREKQRRETPFATCVLHASGGKEVIVQWNGNGTMRMRCTVFVEGLARPRPRRWGMSTNARTSSASSTTIIPHAAYHPAGSLHSRPPVCSPFRLFSVLWRSFFAPLCVGLPAFEQVLGPTAPNFSSTALAALDAPQSHTVAVGAQVDELGTSSSSSTVISPRARPAAISTQARVHPPPLLKTLSDLLTPRVALTPCILRPTHSQPVLANRQSSIAHRTRGSSSSWMNVRCGDRAARGRWMRSVGSDAMRGTDADAEVRVCTGRRHTDDGRPSSDPTRSFVLRTAPLHATQRRVRVVLG